MVCIQYQGLGKDLRPYPLGLAFPHPGLDDLQWYPCPADPLGNIFYLVSDTGISAAFG